MQCDDFIEQQLDLSYEFSRRCIKGAHDSDRCRASGCVLVAGKVPELETETISDMGILVALKLQKNVNLGIMALSCLQILVLLHLLHVM